MNKLSLLSILIFALGCGNNTQSGFENEEPISSAPMATSKIIMTDTVFIVALGRNMSEMKFNKKVIRVPSEKNITIALTNQSTDATMPHNIVFIEKGHANDVGQGGLVTRIMLMLIPMMKMLLHIHHLLKLERLYIYHLKLLKRASMSSSAPIPVIGEL